MHGRLETQPTSSYGMLILILVAGYAWMALSIFRPHPVEMLLAKHGWEVRHFVDRPFVVDIERTKP